MKPNVGTADRIIRLLAAALFILLFSLGYAAGPGGYILLALGIIFVLTSFIGFCPLYMLFGVNSCRR